MLSLQAGLDITSLESREGQRVLFPMVPLEGWAKVGVSLVLWRRAE